MKKKGLAYTLFTLAIVISMITLINVDHSYKKDIETPSIIRGNMILSTLNDVNQDLARSSYISTKRAMLSLVDYAVTNGTFINNSRESTFEVSITGSYNNTQLRLMENTTIANWTESIEHILNRMGITSMIELESYNLTQLDNYQLRLTTTYDINITDPISEATIKRNVTQITLIDYRTFEDPLNTVKSNLVFSTSFIPCNLSQPYGKSLNETSSTTDWTVGRAFKSYDGTGISALSEEEREEKILITHNASNLLPTDVNQFKGIITETNDNLVGVVIPMIRNTQNACTYTENTHIVAMSSDEDKWLNNILTADYTTCFIEHELAPTFFDRLEGNITNGKYIGQGIATFIDPTILPANPGNELDFIYWQYA